MLRNKHRSQSLGSWVGDGRRGSILREGENKGESSTVPFGLTKTSELELHGEDELIENTQLNIH